MFNLLQDLHSMKQGDRSLTNYFTDMKIIWDELEHLRSTPTCSCATVCTCSLSKAVKHFKEIEYVIPFLKGLNDSYSNVRTQILLMDPLPSINKAFALANQQETQPHQTSVDSTAFFVNSNVSNQDKSQTGAGRGRGKPGNRTPMLCSHCKKTNHTMDNCYFKHGFPPGCRSRSQSSTMHVSTDSSSSTFKSPSSRYNDSSEKSLLISRDGYNHLIHLLQSNKVDHSTHASATKTPHSESSSNFISSINKSGNLYNSDSVWILDTGAFDHVCPFIRLFSCIKLIEPVTVKFPTGSTVLAHYSGDIYFSDSLYLKDVLYIPQFQFNLISISKITKTLHCTLTFSHDFCDIQDQLTQRKIGHAKLHHNLYILSQFPNNSACTETNDNTLVLTARNSNFDNIDVWHYRLGHPSHNVLQTVCTSFPYVTFNKNFICDCCHFAKQSRLPFSNPNHITNHPFDLLHMDIWGPISIKSIQGHQYFLTIVDDHTRHTWLFLLKNKSETRHCIMLLSLLLKTISLLL